MKIKVAVIGCGSIAALRHAPEYAANPCVEIAAFCDPAPGRAERLAGIYGGMAFADYEDALALPGVGAVSVCSSNATHAEATVKALRAGKHVLCEKPMATSLADARLMIKEAERCGKALMIGHNQRFAPAHAKARELLASGALGRVLTFRTTIGHGGPESWSADKGAGTWFFRKSVAALGVLGDLGVHKADLLRFLLGDEIDEAYAVTSTMHKKYETGEPIDVEDNAVCILKTRGGVSGTLSASWTYYGSEDTSTVLYCEKGILRIYAAVERPLILERPGGIVETFDVGAIQTNDNQTSTGIIDAFIDCILKGHNPPVTGQDGYEALSVALACSQSAKTGGAVRVCHYGGEDNVVCLPRRAHAAYAVQNLRMETNLTPELPAGRPGFRLCDETYPAFQKGRAGKAAGGKWRQRLEVEIGGGRIN